MLRITLEGEYLLDGELTEGEDDVIARLLDARFERPGLVVIIAVDRKQPEGEVLHMYTLIEQLGLDPRLHRLH